MLKKAMKELEGVDLERLHDAAKAYYSAQRALQALALAQDQFRVAMATGAFASERTPIVLHELDSMALDHASATSEAFRAFQDLAFSALERAMRPGFRGQDIELTLRMPQLQPSVVRQYCAFTYARLDVDLARWMTPSETLVLYVSQDVERYAGPDETAGRSPSQCRAHRFEHDVTLHQAWDWQPTCP